MTTCLQCPPNTQRYIGVGTSAERISCQCSPGQSGSMRLARLAAVAVYSAHHGRAHAASGAGFMGGTARAQRSVERTERTQCRLSPCRVCLYPRVPCRLPAHSVQTQRAPDG